MSFKIVILWYNAGITVLIFVPTDDGDFQGKNVCGDDRGKWGLGNKVGGGTYRLVLNVKLLHYGIYCKWWFQDW